MITTQLLLGFNLTKAVFIGKQSFTRIRYLDHDMLLETVMPLRSSKKSTVL